MQALNSHRSSSVDTQSRPLDHLNVAMPPAPERGVFNSPWTIGPNDCKEIRSRNGQEFELVVEIWPDKIDCPPQALIRFADGLEVVAWSEEIGWEDVTSAKES